ncbi:MAG: polysaccharide biosynthesis C-terminal domain-containing protein [Turicibacter sp.]|nr:polysaccharide biosynthesis C-terminal domain-containing protein [Turicibacter sp.]
MRALTLLTSGFIAHILFGVMNSILVIRALGESGIGVYVLIRPTLAFATTLTGLGRHKIRPALIVAGFLILLANPLSHFVLHEPGTYLPILFIAPLVVLTSLSQKFEGYLLNLDNTTPAAITSLIYQCIRLIGSLYFINRFRHLGAAWVISGLMLAYLLAEATSLLCTGIIFVKQKGAGALPLAIRYLKRPSQAASPEAPVMVIMSATEFLEPIIVMQLFFGLGLPSEISRSLYGAVTGFTMPILLMPLFIAQGLSKATVGALKKEGYANINGLLGECLRLVFSSCGLYLLVVILFPTEVMNLYFQTATGAQYLRILAPFMILYFFKQIFLAFLNALGQSQLAVLPVFLASLLRIALMFLLLPHLRFNIFGLIYATAAYLLVSTTWIFWRLKKLTRLKISPLGILQPLLVFSLSLVAGLMLKRSWNPFDIERLNLGMHILLIGLLYFGINHITKGTDAD